MLECLHGVPRLIRCGGSLPSTLRDTPEARTARDGSHDPAPITTAQAHAVGGNGEIADPANEPPDAVSTAVVATARFQIHLGAVAGVHKTITELGGGRHRLERGRDVVFG
jgi:hypothetical protein